MGLFKGNFGKKIEMYNKIKCKLTITLKCDNLFDDCGLKVFDL